MGIIVLSGPVARVSRITALEDLSRSSGWPIVGVVGVPQDAAPVVGAARTARPAGNEPGADHDSEGRRP